VGQSNRVPQVPHYPAQQKKASAQIPVTMMATHQQAKPMIKMISRMLSKPKQQPNKRKKKGIATDQYVHMKPVKYW
jgi:hypothetical protein